MPRREQDVMEPGEWLTLVHENVITCDDQIKEAFRSIQSLLLEDTLHNVALPADVKRPELIQDGISDVYKKAAEAMTAMGALRRTLDFMDLAYGASSSD